MEFNLNLRRGLVLIGVAALAFVLLASGLPLSVQAAHLSQSGNLLQNPGMEEPYAGGTCGAGHTATGWACWYNDIPKPTDASALQYAVQPYFNDEADLSGQFPELIHGGATSQHFGNQQDPWMAGVMQTVSNIPAGSIVQFCMYARLYANNDKYGKSPSISSIAGRAQVGIAPNGGTDLSSGVVWSGQANPHDTWQQICTQATVGAAGKVTVVTSNDYRGNAAQHLDAWWDDASLTIVGAATPAPGATEAPQQQATSSAPPAPLPSIISTPNPDGSIVHVIQSGDTLFALSIAYNVSLDQILTLNNLTKDALLSIGQNIIIRAPTGPAAPTAAPTSTTPEVPPTAAPTAAPVQVNASLCVQAFDDTNADGLLTTGEQSVAGVQFTVSNSQSGEQISTYTSDGSATPHCFDNLVPGTYSVAVQPAPNTVATSDKRWSVSLTGGSTVNIRFGSRADSSGAAASPTPGAKATGSGSSLSGLLVGGIGLVVLLVAGVLGAFIIARRRA